MPASPDSQPSSEKPEPSTPAAGEPAGAGKLLEEIRERMERLEGNLSLRERRLVRVERALREADAKLQAERAKFAAERGSLEKGLTERLAERERQLESTAQAQQELQKRLSAQLAREREALARVEKLTAERDQIAAELEKTRRDLQEARRGYHEGALQGGGLEGAGSVDAPEGIPAGSGCEIGFSDQRRRSHGRRMAVAITAIISLAAGVATYQYYPWTWRIEGFVRVPFKDARILEQFEQDVAQFSGSGLDLRCNERVPAVVAWVNSPDPDRAIARVNAALEEVVRRASALATRPATQPARLAEREQLQQELRDIDARMADVKQTIPASRPALAANLPGAADASTQLADSGRLSPDVGRLLAGYQKALADRRQLDETLADLAVRLTAKPPVESNIRVKPEQMQAAVAADARLAADSDMLAAREDQLAGMLRKMLDVPKARFEDVGRAVTDANAYLDEVERTTQDQDILESLQAVRDALSNISRSAASIARTWQEEQAALERGGRAGEAPAPQPAGGTPAPRYADPAGRYAAVAAAAKQFIDTTEKALAVMDRAVDAIGQGGDEPTKRLVLQKDLAGKLRPVEEARDAMAALARQAATTENIELANLVQGIAGLKAQVNDRRGRLEAEVRRLLAADAMASYQRQMRDLEARQDAARKAAAELDRAILDYSANAFVLLRDNKAREAALAERAELIRRQAEVLARLHALDDADSREAAATPRVPPLELTPATAVETTPAGARWTWSLLAGLAPMVLLAVLGAARYWQGSGGSLEEYARSLEDLPRPKATGKREKQRK